MQFNDKFFGIDIISVITSRVRDTKKDKAISSKLSLRVDSYLVHKYDFYVAVSISINLSLHRHSLVPKIKFSLLL